MRETAIYNELWGGLWFSVCLMLVKDRDVGWTQISVLESTHRIC